MLDFNTELLKQTITDNLNLLLIQISNRLVLYSSGDCDHGDWVCLPLRFENILVGIKNSTPLKNSLETLWITKWGIELCKGEEMLKNHGLFHIQVE